MKKTGVLQEIWKKPKLLKKLEITDTKNNRITMPREVREELLNA